ARDYATPIAYFGVLKTPQRTASGRAKDRFHFTQDTAEYRALLQDDVELAYGLELALLRAAPPRDIRVAFTEPDSPAAQASIERGASVIAIDGIDAVNSADAASLNAALAPRREGETHRFTLASSDGSTRSVTLGAARITHVPVQKVRTLASSGGPVGYLLFNDHMAAAESQLITAFREFQSAGIADLVIDMRY